MAVCRRLNFAGRDHSWSAVHSFQHLAVSNDMGCENIMSNKMSCPFKCYKALWRFSCGRLGTTVPEESLPCRTWNVVCGFSPSTTFPWIFQPAFSVAGMLGELYLKKYFSKLQVRHLKTASSISVSPWQITDFRICLVKTSQENRKYRRYIWMILDTFGWYCQQTLYILNKSMSFEHTSWQWKQTYKMFQLGFKGQQPSLWSEHKG